MKKRKSKKQAWQMSKSLVEFRLQSLERQFNDLAEKFAHTVKQGVALNNIFALDYLRGMAFLYDDIAAHRHALSSMNNEI